MTTDYYTLLDISQDATAQTIKQAAQARLNQLKNAYSVLSTPEQRMAYDLSAGMELNNHYTLIGVTQDASNEVIKHATQQKISQIKQAFNVLSDSQQRRAYDSEYHAQVEVIQTDTGSFKIKDKGASNDSARQAPGFENVLSASDHIPSNHASGEVDPYDTPDADMDDLEEEDYVLASRASRLSAALLDSLVILSPFVIVAIIAMRMYDGTLDSFEPEQMTAFLEQIGGEWGEVFLAAMVIPFVGIVLLNLYWLYQHGQTIGKRMMKIKIVRTDGSRCSLLRIIFHRHLSIQGLSLIPVLGGFIPLVDILFIFQTSRKCLHDLFADTIVIRT